VGPRTGLDECGKPRPHRDSIPGPSSPERVAIPTELFQPTIHIYLAIKYGTAYWTFTEEVLVGHTVFTASLCVFHFPALPNPKAQSISPLCYVQRVGDL
jgi:hypothetical protein